MNEPVQLAISLISHTNAGKTTLARTLLGRDVGEVRDAAHVTDRIEPHDWLSTETGDRLVLWDTPGFGDSNRLANRLAQTTQPIGWLLSRVWDRWRDRPFWASQQAARHVRDTSDVVLYLVNAAEDPADATYVDAEMRLLAWIDKPVIVLLNQLGEPRDATLEAAERERWVTHLHRHPLVREVMLLDAFARCWVQEIVLLEAIDAQLQDGQRTAMQRLSEAWRGRQQAVFDATIRALAQRLSQTATDHEPIESIGLGHRLREAGSRLGGRPTPEDHPRERAMRRLADRLRERIRQSTDSLISLHRLRGQARAAVLDKLARYEIIERGVDEGSAALVGGVITGSLAGLKADLVAGGLTMGAGMIAGGVIGALTAAGAARAYNRIRQADRDELAWSDEALREQIVAALLTYLLVAHFGRGRGDWDDPGAAPHWAPIVRDALQAQPATLEALRRLRIHASTSDPRTLEDSLAALDEALHRLAIEVLGRLYPAVPIERAVMRRR